MTQNFSACVLQYFFQVFAALWGKFVLSYGSKVHENVIGCSFGSDQGSPGLLVTFRCSCISCGVWVVSLPQSSRQQGRNFLHQKPNPTHHDLESPNNCSPLIVQKCVFFPSAEFCGIRIPSLISAQVLRHQRWGFIIFYKFSRTKTVRIEETAKRDGLLRLHGL